MKPANAKVLFDKYQSETCSPEERAIVENWLTFGEAAPLDLSEPELQTDLTEIRKRLALTTSYQSDASSSGQPYARHRTAARLWPRILTIAAAVTAITLGVWLYYVSSSTQGETSSLFANDVSPGKNTATLRLADGRIIKLSEAKTGVVIDALNLKYSDGTALGDTVGLRADDKVQTLTASTPRGGTYQVILPDGTRVWLNAASSISFPSQFLGKERHVVADGEVYFEVSKDPKRPFTVESRGQRVEVLGTHFNINSYQDEGAVKTTLEEGSIKVSASADQPVSPSQRVSVVTLRPGEQSVVSGGEVDVRPAVVEQALAWKNGEFIFKADDFESAMRRIARWYDVEVVYQNTKPITLEPRGWVSRTSKLSSVLTMIQSTREVHFKIEGRRIIVTN